MTRPGAVGLARLSRGASCSSPNEGTISPASQPCQLCALTHRALPAAGLGLPLGRLELLACAVPAGLAHFPTALLGHSASHWRSLLEFLGKHWVSGALQPYPSYQTVRLAESPNCAPPRLPPSTPHGPRPTAGTAEVREREEGGQSTGERGREKRRQGAVNLR